MPTSKETRVRVEAFSKIMPSVLPESGRGQCENGFRRMTFSSAARLKSAFSSSPEKSQSESRSRFVIPTEVVYRSSEDFPTLGVLDELIACTDRRLPRRLRERL